MVTVETYCAQRVIAHLNLPFSSHKIIEASKGVYSEYHCSLLINYYWSRLIIHFLLYYLSSSRLREVNNKRNFQAFRSKSGCN